MKSGLPEHICCVRSKLVNEIDLTGTYLLRTQTICAGINFSGTFTLRTQHRHRPQPTATVSYKKRTPDLHDALTSIILNLMTPE